MIQAVFFDFDGTLIDLNERWIKPLFSAIHEVKPDMDIENVENNIGSIIQKSGGKTNFLVYNAITHIAKTAGLNFFQRKLLWFKLSKRRKLFKRIVPVEGGFEVLRQLKGENLPLALVTTASKKTIKTAIKEFPEFNTFDVVITRDDVTDAKPNPEALILAAERLGIDPKNAVMVGDLPVDIQAAKAAGAKSIAVLGSFGKFTEQPLLEAKPDFIVKKIDEVVPIILDLTK